MPLSPISHMLYDNRGRVLWVSRAFPPHKLPDCIGQPAWAFVKGDDVSAVKAAFLSATTERLPQSVDVICVGAGLWRLTFLWVGLRNARVLGIARKVPLGVLQLTSREREVCRELAKGNSSKLIGHELGISRSTVDNHRANIAGKLRIPTAAIVPWAGLHSEWLDVR